MPSTFSESRVAYVISDLHLGAGGPRDNFEAKPGNRRQLNLFLDYVERQNAALIIAGDLFEFWQFHLADVLHYNEPILDRLVGLDSTYILGNHETDISGGDCLSHPLFQRICPPITLKLNGKAVLVMHGHETCQLTSHRYPGWDRALTIISALCEDVAKSPRAWRWSVEDLAAALGDRCMSLLKWAIARFKRQDLSPWQNYRLIGELVDSYADKRAQEDLDAILVGHTHDPGGIGSWYFNTGSWVGTVNTVGKVNEDGRIEIQAWDDGKLVPYTKELR